MLNFILVVHIMLAIGMISLILMQQGKGADAGASFGAGASGTVFGASGTGNFLTKSTAILTTLFFITSITLAVMAKNASKNAFKLGDTTTAVVDAKVSEPTKTQEANTLPVAPPASITAPATTPNVPAQK